MAGSNLPPGCNVSDIPGNSPEDAALEDAEERLMNACTHQGLTPAEYGVVQKIGITVVLEMRAATELRIADLRHTDQECKDAGHCPFGCGPCDRNKGE